MNILLVVAHPNAQSFNHGLANAFRDDLQTAGHTLRVKDLYAEGFDPVLTAAELAAIHAGDLPTRIVEEQQALAWADGLLLVYPLWWFDRPAILKGWFDCILTSGFAFQYHDNGVDGLLPLERAMVVMTTGGSAAEIAQMQAQELIIRPVTDGTLGFCGVKNVQAEILYAVTSQGEEQGAKLIAQTSAKVESFFEE